MPDTTFEEAKRCPKCGVPGRQVQKTRAPNGNGDIFFFQCESSEACKWYKDGTWMVQVDVTGSVPTHDKEDKQFPALPQPMINRASRLLDEVEHAPKDSEV